MSKNRSDRESSLPKPFAGSLLVSRRRLGALAAAALSCAARGVLPFLWIA